MHKQRIPMVSITLILACSAGAFVGQEQGFNIGAANCITWSGGVGLVEGGHQAVVCQGQSVAGGWNAPSGFQREGGLFHQTASAGGGGPAFVKQTADIVGNQHQGTGMWGQPTASLGQQMNIDFTTNVVKPWGTGTASASQSFIGGQVQAFTTPTTMGTQSQFVGVREYANIVGGAAADPTVNNSISIGLSQNQLTTAPCPSVCRP